MFGASGAPGRWPWRSLGIGLEPEGPASWCGVVYFCYRARGPPGRPGGRLHRDRRPRAGPRPSSACACSSELLQEGEDFVLCGRRQGEVQVYAGLRLSAVLHDGACDGRGSPVVKVGCRVGDAPETLPTTRHTDTLHEQTTHNREKYQGQRTCADVGGVEVRRRVPIRRHAPSLLFDLRSPRR